ncbi:MAG: amidohydrolase [Actinobacteria bacterium]|nr:amidohydrolase [Actinomycetota bacterium]
MIVDAHTHIFPPEVIERRDIFAKRDSSFEFIYGDPKARMVTYPELIEEMDSSGVDMAIVCGFPWRSLDLCRQHNNYMMEAVRAHPDRLTGLAIVNPVAGNASDRELERCLDGGLKGVGEISADAQGFRLDDTSTAGRIASVVAEAGLFILIHANEDVGHFYPGKTPTSPASVYRFLEKFPDTTTVLGHWGGGLFFYELMPEVAKLTSSVYYDTAASPFLYRQQVYRVAVDIVGPGRILFATDYPLLRMQRHLNEINRAGLSEDALAAILGRNAKGLLGLEF